MLSRFRTYLVAERAVVEGTARFYLHVARQFLSERGPGEDLGLSTWAKGPRFKSLSFSALTAMDDMALTKLGKWRWDWSTDTRWSAPPDGW